MIPRLIQRAEDLQTKHKAICDGFLGQALQKTEKARPFIEEAGKFYKALKKVRDIQGLLNTDEFRRDLASACGFSDKAVARLSKVELDKAVKSVLTRIHKESGREFRENLLYRYLLTKGDTLGGKMRNVTGASAGTRLAEKIIERLTNSKIQIKKSKTEKVQRIIWGSRTLLFDVKPKLIKKNVDVSLIDSGDVTASEQKLLVDKAKYIACGELKGGIDPAGADEHWKTANSALGRIRTVFGRKAVALFFIGAAIEASMAKEIFQQLKAGTLSHAANLNEDEQVHDLVDWLLTL